MASRVRSFLGTKGCTARRGRADVLLAYGVLAWVGTVAACCDNAVAGAFVASFTCELVVHHRGMDLAGARHAIARWVE